MSLVLGVEAIDQSLGKVPKGTRVLLTCAADVDGRALLIQAAAAALQANQSVVYVVADRPPNAVRRKLRSLHGTDAGTLVFVDAHSGRMADRKDFPVSNPEDLGELVTRIGEAQRAHKDAVLIVESLSSFINRDSGAFFESGAKLLEAMAKFPLSITHHVIWKYLPDVSSFLSMFEANLLFHAVEQRIARNNVLRFDRVNWVKSLPSAPRFIAILPDGAVRLLIPKIVITGPKNAGKTTFLKSLSTEAVGTERGDTTVALDKGRYEDGGVVADLFGTPGDKRFDPIAHQILEQAAAVIFLVDASDPSSFERAHEQLKHIHSRGLHVIAAANKQDAEGALGAAAIEKEFGVPTLECSANDPKSSRRVMQSIIERINARHP